MRLETIVPKKQKMERGKTSQNNRGNSGSGGWNRNGNSEITEIKGFGKFKGRLHTNVERKATELPNVGAMEDLREHRNSGKKKGRLVH